MITEVPKNTTTDQDTYQGPEFIEPASWSKPDQTPGDQVDQAEVEPTAKVAKKGNWVMWVIDRGRQWMAQPVSAAERQRQAAQAEQYERGIRTMTIISQDTNVPQKKVLLNTRGVE